MDFSKMTIRELLVKYREEHLTFKLKDGRSVTGWVQEVENELDGWDGVVFQITPDNPNDPLAIDDTEIDSITKAN